MDVRNLFDEIISQSTKIEPYLSSNANISYSGLFESGICKYIQGAKLDRLKR